MDGREFSTPLGNREFRISNRPRVTVHAAEIFGVVENAGSPHNCHVRCNGADPLLTVGQGSAEGRQGFGGGEVAAEARSPT